MSDPKFSVPAGVSEAFVELVDIIARLRAPGGCPWDREQTHETLKPYVIEESYEVVDAIDTGSTSELCEELGDLLLQVVLHAQVAVEADEFDIVAVIRGISSKLVSRHPHVFGDTRADDALQVLTNWEKLKKKEKVGRGIFDGLPQHLPALQRAARMGEKAGRIGFDWENTGQVRRKFDEELTELEEAIGAGDEEQIHFEMGDLLFAAAQWSRHLGVHPEEALRASCARFQGRFSKMESRLEQGGESFEGKSVDELENLWREAKR